MQIKQILFVFKPIKRVDSRLSTVPILLLGEKELEIANSVDFLEVAMYEAVDWSEQLGRIEGKLVMYICPLGNLRHHEP